MSDIAARLRENVDRVRSSMAHASERAGRNPAGVRLVAVTKYAEIKRVRELVALGHTTLGESRPQQLVERSDQLGPGIEWHLIGTLQRNKVRAVLPHVSLIHSVDSLKLLERIDSVAAELRLKPRVLLQVNVSGETSKQGFSPDELPANWPAIAAYRNVTIVGLMTMAPLADDPELARPTFRGLRRVRDELRHSTGDAAQLAELSMGMSNDFEVAIEEGATLVRVGSLLFDGLEAIERET
jgi:pyridoxal phosphate enzyme (YggS family)